MARQPLVVNRLGVVPHGLEQRLASSGTFSSTLKRTAIDA
jgi:hypothetical protein